MQIQFGVTPSCQPAPDHRNFDYARVPVNSSPDMFVRALPSAPTAQEQAARDARKILHYVLAPMMQTQNRLAQIWLERLKHPERLNPAQFEVMNASFLAFQMQSNIDMNRIMSLMLSILPDAGVKGPTDLFQVLSDDAVPPNYYRDALRARYGDKAAQATFPNGWERRVQN